MEYLGVQDLFKIGIGPSSSHTLGPWKAALLFLKQLQPNKTITHFQCDLYGSLAKTGHGHGTPIAITLGLAGFDPVLMTADAVQAEYAKVKENFTLPSGIHFNPTTDIDLRGSELLPYHSNGMILRAYTNTDLLLERTYYSTGGGFVYDPLQPETFDHTPVPYPFTSAKELLTICTEKVIDLKDLSQANEDAIRPREETTNYLNSIWQVMRTSALEGMYKEGILPGRLKTKRRAGALLRNFFDAERLEHKMEDFSQAIIAQPQTMREKLSLVSGLALSVNEVNAAYGRIVTAPTNGASGVIPAVLMNHLLTIPVQQHEEEARNFLLVASLIGSLYKQNATISAAMGGCQAEIGVASSMAAAGLTYLEGGSTEQICMAAEIAMEHHLGLTCDPIAGLVQIPCIERNSMGAVKAITAAALAMHSDPDSAKVSLDQVVETMWQTAQDMHTNYKETSEAGLATKVSVGLSEC